LFLLISKLEGLITVKKLALPCIILFAIVFLMPLNGAFAQTRTIGVSVGDTFKYTYTLDFNMSNSSDFALPSMLDSLFDQAKSIEWARLTILNISGTSVTVQTQLHFKNGTEQSSVSTTDIATGQGNSTLFLVASNLNKNDTIYTSNFVEDRETINETITRTFQSGSRQLNHQSLIMDYSVGQDEASNFNMTSFQQHNTEDIYWDRQLGVLVEMSYEMVTQSPTFNANISLKMNLVESNKIVIPEFPTLLPMALILLASGSAVAIYRKRR
jgi:hypothetical protein